MPKRTRRGSRGLRPGTLAKMSNEQLSKAGFIRIAGFTRADGTKVKSHVRKLTVRESAVEALDTASDALVGTAKFFTEATVGNLSKALTGTKKERLEVADKASYFVPGVGEARLAKDSKDAFSRGEVVAGSLLALGTVASLVPVVGDLAGKGLKSIAKGFKGIGKTKPLAKDAMSFTRTGKGFGNPSPVVREKTVLARAKARVLKAEGKKAGEKTNIEMFIDSSRAATASGKNVNVGLVKMSASDRLGLQISKRVKPKAPKVTAQSFQGQKGGSLKTAGLPPKGGVMDISSKVKLSKTQTNKAIAAKTKAQTDKRIASFTKSDDVQRLQRKHEAIARGDLKSPANINRGKVSDAHNSQGFAAPKKTKVSTDKGAHYDSMADMAAAGRKDLTAQVTKARSLSPAKIRLDKARRDIKDADFGMLKSQALATERGALRKEAARKGAKLTPGDLKAIQGGKMTMAQAIKRRKNLRK